MKIRIRSLTTKLLFSYLVVVLVIFCFVVYLRDKQSAWNFSLTDFLFALGLAFALGVILAAGIVRPINKIIHGARKFAQGDFSHRILLDATGGIGELTSALNKMAADIESKIKEIEMHSQHLSAILQNMTEGIIVLDKTSRILSINTSAEKLFSISRTEALNRLFLEIVPNNTIAELINDVLQSGQFISQELSLAWPVQKVLRIDASALFEKDSISGCLVVIHDVSAIRRLDKMRSDFVANVSHELKTPLTSIKGFVETLLDGAIDDNPNARHFLEIIQDHTNRLNSLVDDLLSLSYLEAKEVTLKKEQVNLRELGDEILAGFQAQLKKQSVTSRNDLPAEMFVQADKNKLGQVLINLIDNAIKFNRENGSLRLYDAQTNDGVIKIVVEDTGIGIPRKDIPRIFERFYRVDKARSREMGGTGLGLAIVKHIIELHGGTVGTESAEGIGSRFFFTLP